jgi:hypothetical protein
MAKNQMIQHFTITTDIATLLQVIIQAVTHLFKRTYYRAVVAKWVLFDYL